MQFYKKKYTIINISYLISIRVLLFCAFMIITGEISVIAQNPQRMIEIQATIFEYRFGTEKQLGIFYQYNKKSGSWRDSDVFLHGTSNIWDDPIPALDVSGSFAKFKYGSVDYNIKTAIDEGRATVISNPTVLTTDGKRAALTSGEKVPLTSLEKQGNLSSLTSGFRETGTKLIVTPKIFKNTYIILNLEIESSEIASFQTFDRGDKEKYELPVVTSKNINSAVILPSGSTLYIGGLYTRNTGDVTRKVPVLGDVPVLGFFLRGFSKDSNNTETIFRITPIIRSPGTGLDPSVESSIFGNLLKKEIQGSVSDPTKALQLLQGKAAGAAVNSATAAPQPAASAIAPATPAQPAAASIQPGTQTANPATQAAPAAVQQTTQTIEKSDRKANQKTAAKNNSSTQDSKIKIAKSKVKKNLSPVNSWR